MYPISSTQQHSPQSFKDVRSLIQESASYSQSKRFNFVKSWLENTYHEYVSAEGIDNYLAQKEQISRNVIGARVNSDGCYSCEINCAGRKYSLTQTDADSDSIILCDIQSNEQVRLDDISFPILKKEFLIKYIEQPRRNCYSHTQLGTFDLMGIDLTGIDFKDIGLSSHNVAVIMAQGGNLVGARLEQNTDLRGLRLSDKVLVDQKIVSALIKAGIELKSVLQHYFGTPPTQLSRQFKAEILSLFLERERRSGNVLIDLSKFDLNDVDFKSVNLCGTLLNLSHLRLIIACDGDLTGATLDNKINATHLKLNNVKLDQAVAKQLIAAGADRGEVLMNYLSTERHLGHTNIDIGWINLNGVELRGIYFLYAKMDRAMADKFISAGVSRRTVLSNYLATERSLNHINIDIEWIKLTGIDFQYLDVHGVKTSKALAMQLIKAGANQRSVFINYLATERSLGHTNIDIDGFDLTLINTWGIDLNDVQLNLTDEQKHLMDFQHNLMILLTLFSQTVASVLFKSSTLDTANKAPKHVAVAHGEAVKYSHQFDYSDHHRLAAAIKSSTGNCSDMSYMSKGMLDLYLDKLLKAMGYRHALVKTFIYVAPKPCDHYVVRLECRYGGKTKHYLVDPWSDGKAWSYADGMHYFRIRKPDQYTNPNIRFVTSGEKSACLEKESYLASIGDVFNRYSIEHTLNSHIDNSHTQFVNLPIAQQYSTTTY